MYSRPEEHSGRSVREVVHWANGAGRSALLRHVLKEEEQMSCCSDEMKPIEASSCCTLQDTRCASHARFRLRLRAGG